MTALLIEIAVRILVFGLVFGFAIYRNKNISVKPKFALPVVAIVFALLNVGLYWLLKPVLNIATLGMAWIFLPFVINGGFLLVTSRVLKKMRIEIKLDGILTIAWLAGLLTLAHGALYVVFHYFV